jgi:hypothetical protein
MEVVVDEARFVLGMMFAAARIRNETVGLVRFAGDAAATDARVEIEHAMTPSKDLAFAWFERAQRLGTTENVRYAVRFFKRGKSEGTYALPAVVRMPATTADEAAYEDAAREAKEERDRLRTVVSRAYRFGQALARGRP